MKPGREMVLPPLFAQEHVTILVTDSGLGGLAIFAAIAARLKTDPIWPAVSLIYFNAWPEQHRGYNRLKGTTERVRVFDQALAGMLRYQPDIIMIACNTLSAIYKKTAFSRETTLPVIDIIQFGVDMLYEHLAGKKEARALLLGTVTTIASDFHRAALIEKGIPANCLVTQPCDQLATCIESGPQSDRVRRMIATFMGQAVEKLDAVPPELYTALLCTHFGYSQDLIKAQLEGLLKVPVTILDPNRRMAGFLFTRSAGRRREAARTDLRIVSRIRWDQAKIEAISKIVTAQSPDTARALLDYDWIPDLFAV
jgi:glutamate racemase